MHSHDVGEIALPGRRVGAVPGTGSTRGRSERPEREAYLYGQIVGYSVGRGLGYVTRPLYLTAKLTHQIVNPSTQRYCGPKSTNFFIRAAQLGPIPTTGGLVEETTRERLVHELACCWSARYDRGGVGEYPA